MNSVLFPASVTTLTVCENTSCYSFSLCGCDQIESSHKISLESINDLSVIQISESLHKVQINRLVYRIQKLEILHTFGFSLNHKRQAHFIANTDPINTVNAEDLTC